MINVMHLDIEKTNSITITVPELSEKINYFYEPTNKLHKFDEVSVYLDKENARILIARDVAQDIIGSLWGSLYECLYGKRSVIEEKFIGKIGWFYNKDTYVAHLLSEEEFVNHPDTVEYFSYWLWSSNLKIQTWLYAYKDIIYLEITPSYQLFYSEDFVQDDKVFEKYLVDYKPLFFAEVSRSKAQEWLEQCERIICDVDSGYMIDEFKSKNSNQ